jgi:hypothetical protein
MIARTLAEFFETAAPEIHPIPLAAKAVQRITAIQS